MTEQTPPRGRVRVGDPLSPTEASLSANGHADEALPEESDGEYLAGLVAAATDKKNRTSVVEVARPLEGAPPDEGGRVPEKVLFRFGVRLVDDREDDAARDKHTSSSGLLDAAGRPVETTDWVRYRCQVIFDATVDKPYHDTVDGQRVRVAGKELWRNPAAWEAVAEATGQRVVNPIDFIYAVLLPEEKARIFAHISNLSRVQRGREVRRGLNG